MSISRKCDRCGEHFEVDKVKELRYYGTRIGHYHTIHLCNDVCHKDFEKLFMQGLNCA